MRTFFRAEDYDLYLKLLRWFSRLHRVSVWAYCLMPNHVHLMLLPPGEDSLARMVGEMHRNYTLRINQREGWKGHLWQGRFFSTPMDEPHVLLSARYIEANPVRAGLVREPWEWPWSSARAHLLGKSDFVTDTRPLLRRCDDWSALLQTTLTEQQLRELRLHERTGRPLGDSAFVQQLEQVTGRKLLPQRPGPQPVRESGGEDLLEIA